MTAHTHTLGGRDEALLGECREETAGMAAKVLVWRISLAVLAVANSVLLAAVLSIPAGSSAAALQRMLGIPYLLQIFFRSFFISEYVNWHTVTASPLNSPLFARMIAFIGELCFGMQLAAAMWLHWDAQTWWFPRAAACLLILGSDLLAQCCATLGTALRHNGFFIIEALLWTLIFVVCALAAFLNTKFLAVDFWSMMLVISVPSIVYMVSDYCPMFHAAWKSQPCRPVTYEKLLAGIYGSLVGGVKTSKWQVWKDEWVWQSLYFCFGAWCSMWLMTDEANTK